MLAGEGIGSLTVLSVAPHCEQNLAPGRFSLPHDGHRTRTGVPHWSQNLPPSRTSARQLRHCMPHLGFGNGERTTGAPDAPGGETGGRSLYLEEAPYGTMFSPWGAVSCEYASAGAELFGQPFYASWGHALVNSCRAEGPVLAQAGILSCVIATAIEG